ncbi:MAG: hypothetical protein M1819_006218 [Sarea resinae]|nr:MAG: hypothetical protein M1819_006218 [Sarea resinae]
MSTNFIAFLPPPGASISSYNRALPPGEQSDEVPEIFREAMSIREEVFVHEQHVALENELDSDDARSFHWVVSASVSNTQKETAEGRKSSETNRVPVGTVRLVPPPHPPHPKPGSDHKIDNAEDVPLKSEGVEPTGMHDGKEPYVKLGRLATLAPYRGLGLGRFLVNAALEWASKNRDTVMPLPDPTVREAKKMDGGTTEEEITWKGLVLVHAQISAQGMWSKLGFVRDEAMGTWDEEGIGHVGMWKRLTLPKER